MLGIRPYKKCDAQKIASWCKDKKTFLYWGGERFGSFPLLPDAINEKYYEKNGDCEEPDNFYPFTAFDGDDLVGHFIMRYVNRDKQTIRFGFVIVDSEKRGKKYGQTMLKQGLLYAFEMLKAKKVTIGVYDGNDAAYHCYTSLGFRESKETPFTYDEVNGEQWKRIELEITKEEYEKREIN